MSAYDDYVKSVSGGTYTPATVPTDASSGSTLDGGSWLTNLLKTGISGYVAVQTVKNQNRTAGAVTTQDIPRVADPSAGSTPSTKTLLLAGGVLVGVLVLVLLMGRRK